MRWRLEWADAGHRRAATVRVARRVAEARPELVNDPREAPWHAVVHERAGRLTVELWPVGLVDPRFRYRVSTVPASSHPTIAAALAHVGGAKRDDVVWDPFVGAGVELVERAKLGPYRELIGSDVDAGALAAAKENLAAAGIERVRLRRADARVFVPGRPVSLVITNPPMGRRIPSDGKGEKLLASVLARAASVLVPGGRMVWMSPRPAETASRAAEHGLALREHHAVDMGGLAVEMQLFVKLAASTGERPARAKRPPGRPSPAGTARRRG
jgi:23S rRNA G2445 N2-methylase RlmL